MTRDNIVEFYENQQKDHILFSFKGEVTSKLTDSILAEVEGVLAKNKMEKRYIKKICNITIECLQNLYHHNVEPEIPSSPLIKDFRKEAIYMLTSEGDSYYIKSGNFMLTENNEILERKLNIINNLEDKEIKNYYQEQLSNSTQSEKGTAGLGFLDMRRKSGNPLTYEIHKLDNTYSFFCLSSKIDTLKKD